ncbi:hypothetical protein CONPUDRAFT_144650 [Coniophora puteana RWD-64-598 SS2]|uniref:Uncharacterized protein n=1 Tax=Coniophora puteana (strain RWD-64-598) TaxID=741705 RepID=A0A5M3MQ10_CONPW|nr:uncharacterized protein CONPUDRAFT_144650 [Coniophora puteana RWD-64-598 SS2]EIW80651.1 hypothetical protein CONPUDRAFT_144650 [Coniophora puteana RWD-64-598 SS2]
MSRFSSHHQFASPSSSPSSPPSSVSSSPFTPAGNFDDYRHTPPSRPTSQPAAAYEGQPQPQGRHFQWESAGPVELEVWDGGPGGETCMTIREHIPMLNPDMCDHCYYADFEYCIHVEPLTMLKESTMFLNRPSSEGEEDESRFSVADTPRIEQFSPYPPPPPPMVFVDAPHVPSSQQVPLSPMHTAASLAASHSGSPVEEIFTHQTQPWTHVSSTGLPPCSSPPPTPRLAPWELAGAENSLHLNANPVQDAPQGPAPTASPRLPRYLALRSPAASPKPASPRQLPRTHSPSPSLKSSVSTLSPNVGPLPSCKPPASPLPTSYPLPPSPSPSPRPASLPLGTNAKTATPSPAKEPPTRSNTQSTSLSALTILATPAESRRRSRASSDSNVVRDDTDLRRMLGIQRRSYAHAHDAPGAEGGDSNNSADSRREREQVKINVVPPSDDPSGGSAQGDGSLKNSEISSSDMLRVDVNFRSSSPHIRSRKHVTLVSPTSTSSTPLSGVTALPNPFSPMCGGNLAISPASAASNTVVGSDDGYESAGLRRARKHDNGGDARRSTPKAPVREDATAPSPSRDSPPSLRPIPRRSSLFATDEEPHRPDAPASSVSAWLASHSDEAYEESELSFGGSSAAPSSPATRFLQPEIGFDEWLAAHSPGVSPAPALVDLDAASPAPRRAKVSSSECEWEEEGAGRIMRKLAMERQRCEIAKLAECAVLASVIRRDVSQAYAHLDKALSTALEALDYDLVLMGHHQERRWANEFVDVLCSMRRSVARTMAHIDEIPRADHIVAHTAKITDLASQLESRSDKVKRSVNSVKLFQLKTQLREEQDTLQRTMRREQARREAFDAETRKEKLAQKEKIRRYEALSDATHRRAPSAP